jgi:hypothetical protein
MYNEEIKRQFLNEIDARGRTFAMYSGELERAAKYEELFGKDLCAFSVEEFAECVNGNGGTSTHGLQTKASTLKRYATWACRSGHTELNPNEELFLISPSGIADTTSNISKSLIKDPQHLKNILDAIDIFNETPQSFMGLNKVRRVFAWLMYSGMQRDDIVKVKDSNVDLKRRFVVFESNIYPIYYLALQDFKDLLSMTVMDTKKTSKKIIMQFPRVEGDLLLRGEANPTFKSLYNNFGMLIKAASKVNPDVIPLSYKKMHCSGIFYEAYLEETETGNEPRFATQARRDLEATTDWEKSSDASKKDRIYKKALNYRTDYKRWKTAFDL